MRINGWSIPTSFVVGGTDDYAIAEHIVYYEDLSKMAAVQACYCYVEQCGYLVCHHRLKPCKATL